MTSVFLKTNAGLFITDRRFHTDSKYLAVNRLRVHSLHSWLTSFSENSLYSRSTSFRGLLQEHHLVALHEPARLNAVNVKSAGNHPSRVILAVPYNRLEARRLVLVHE